MRLRSTFRARLGGHGCWFQDPQAAEPICKAVRGTIGHVPLFAKLEYTPGEQGDEMLSQIVKATVPSTGYGAVNAVPGL